MSTHLVRPTRELLVVGLLLAAQAAAQSPLVVTVGRLMAGDGAWHAPGRIVIQGGRIVALGPAGAIPLPAGAEHRELLDGVAIPGLIDAASHFGIERHKNDLTVACLPDVRLRDVAESSDALRASLAAAGLTAVQVIPGDANLIGGRTAIGRPSRSVGFEWLIEEHALHVSFDDRQWPREIPPTSLIGGAEMVAEILKREDLRAYAQAPGRLFVSAPNARDVDSAASLLERLANKPVIFTTLEGASRAAKRASAFSGVVIEAFAPEMGPLEADGLRALFAAPIPVAFGTRGSTKAAPEALRFAAVVARTKGVPAERLHRALTADAAAIAGLSGQAGSLSAGLLGDVTVWSGDPTDARSKLLLTVASGRVAYAAGAVEVQR